MKKSLKPSHIKVSKKMIKSARRMQGSEYGRAPVKSFDPIKLSRVALYVKSRLIRSRACARA
jgi:hypothetical protein